MNNNNAFAPYFGGGPPANMYYDNEPDNVDARSHADERYRYRNYDERHHYSNYERPCSFEEYRRDYYERHSAAEDHYTMPWEQDGWGKTSIILERLILILIFRITTTMLINEID